MGGEDDGEFIVACGPDSTFSKQALHDACNLSPVPTKKITVLHILTDASKEAEMRTHFESMIQEVTSDFKMFEKENNIEIVLLPKQLGIASDIIHYVEERG